MIKKYILILSLISSVSYALSTDYDNATNAGKSFGSMLAGQSSALTTSSSQSTVMNNLGVDAHPIGQESSMQASNMGVTGSLYSEFNFKIKPACTSTQYVPGFNGSYIEIPCATGTGVINAKVCINSINGQSLDCNNEENYKDINLPINNNPVKEFGYTFNSVCNSQGLCTGKMSQDKSIITNSSNIDNDAQSQAQNNTIYNTIKDSYVGKDGYSHTTSYMNSFTDKGSNNIFAQCTANTAGVLKNGVYTSCNGKESDSFDATCHIIHECTAWDLITKTVTTNQTCDLTPGSKNIACIKSPKVIVTNDPYQVSESYSGNMTASGHLQYNSDLPENGTITSFKFSSTGKQGMRANSDYKFYLNGVYIGVMPHTSPYGIWISTISINASKISVPVTGKHILLSVTGYNDDAIWSSPFSLTMLVTRYHKVAHTTWVTDCPPSEAQ